MSSESDSGRPTSNIETSESIAVKQARQHIEEHINTTDLDSPRFQAFADYADYIQARSERALTGGNDIHAIVRLCLIEETIRKRENRVSGYKQEFARVSNLFSEFADAMYNTGDLQADDAAKRDRAHRIRHGSVPEDVHYLQNLKNRAIEKKS